MKRLNKNQPLQKASASELINTGHQLETVSKFGGRGTLTAGLTNTRPTTAIA